MGQKRKSKQKNKAPFSPTAETPQKDSSYTPLLSKICWVICILAGAALSLKNLREPDLWWIFRTGEWIVDNVQVPREDTFSYTMAGTEWINVKWGFEVIAYVFQEIGGPAFVYVFQALITMGCLFLLGAIYRQFKLNLFPTNNQWLGAGLIIGTILALIAWEFRINGRPETFSHLMVLVFAYFLISYRQNPSRHIAWLIPLQIIWTNFHEAYGTGIVMLGAFTVASWIDYWLHRQKGIISKGPKPVWLSGVLVLAILAMAINPRGWEMILHPWNIYQQLGANKFTTELFSFTHPNYWQFQAYLNLAFLALTVIGILLPYNRGQNNPFPWYWRPFDQLGTGYLLFLGMFFYLSLTAYRNIPFFILISLPVVALSIDYIIGLITSQWPQKATKLTFYGWLVLVGLMAAFYLAIPTNTYYEALDRNDQYGMQVNAVKNPVGAARFIEAHDIEGRCFADYLTSSYLMWEFRPDFKTFIDLRDLDVFPAKFFNRFAQITKYPDQVFNKADSLYDFQYAVVHRLNFPKLHQHLLQAQDYEPVFADPVAVIYLKDNQQNQSLIQQYGYQDGKRDIFRNTKPVKASSISSVINHLLWPPFHFDQYRDINFDAIASDFYRQFNDLEKAYEKAKASLNHDGNPAKGYASMGNLYLIYGQQAQSNQKQQEYQQEAFQYFKQTLEYDPSNANALTNLGALSLQSGNLEEAEAYLNQATQVDPNNSRAYQYLAKVYNQKANTSSQKREQHMEQRLEYLEKAHRIDPDDVQVLLSLGIGHCQLDACSDARPYLEDIKDRSISMNPSVQQSFKACYQQCFQ